MVSVKQVNVKHRTTPKLMSKIAKFH